MFRRILLASLLAILPIRAYAVTGQEFLTYCTEFVRNQGTRQPTDGLNTGFCIGFMHGVLDSADLTRAQGGKPKFCFPQTAKVDQAIRVVEKHLRENPELLHFSAVSQAHLALGRAFPCR
jgi:hypothetical protein